MLKNCQCFLFQLVNLDLRDHHAHQNQLVSAGDKPDQYLMTLNYVIKRVLIECRKTQTKLWSKANREKGKYQKEPMRPRTKNKHF